jgi:hypothetical protein
MSCGAVHVNVEEFPSTFDPAENQEVVMSPSVASAAGYCEENVDDACTVPWLATLTSFAGAVVVVGACVVVVDALIVVVVPRAVVVGPGFFEVAEVAAEPALR